MLPEERQQLDFSGNVPGTLEALERSQSQYAGSSGEAFEDCVRNGVVMNRLTDTELATHLVMREGYAPRDECRRSLNVAEVQTGDWTYPEQLLGYTT